MLLLEEEEEKEEKEEKEEGEEVLEESVSSGMPIPLSLCSSFCFCFLKRIF